MFRARAFVAFALTCALLPSPSRPTEADAPVPLDYKAYDGWNRILSPKLSDDGRYLAYALTPQDGDATLVVHDLDSHEERRELRGTWPLFAADGRFLVFTHPPARKDVDAARKAKKAERDQPKYGVGILDLISTKPAEIIENIHAVPANAAAITSSATTPMPSAEVSVAKNGGATIAYRAEPSPAPSASPPAPPSPSPVASASASPAPAASESPAPKADKTKAIGAPLTIRNLVSGKRVIAPDATEFATSDDDRFVAYATETKNGKGDGVHVYDVASGATNTVLRGEGRYRNLALARDGTALAFLSDTATFKDEVPHDSLYVVDLRAAKPSAVKAVDLGTPGLAAHTTPNANGKLSISRDGKRVFFGTAAAPTPIPSGTPAPQAVDVWSWRDDVLQSQQKHDAAVERKRTYLGVYDLAASRFAQLGSVSLRDVAVNDNASVALGQDDRAYRRRASWFGELYRDVYAVSLADGRRTLLQRAAPRDVTELSPGGQYVVSWDEAARHWVSVRVADRKRVVLASNAGVPFYLVDDDHPAPPPPYGKGGWLAGDRGVYLYDRYDIWLANPETGAATNITGGAGRRARTVFSLLQIDPDATSFAPENPLLLGLIDTRTFSSGFARVPATGGVVETKFKTDEIVNGSRNVVNDGLHGDTRAPLVAKHGDRYVFARASFRRYPDLWAGNSNFASEKKVTDANPQQSKYRWGTERLVGFRCADGTPLRAVMLVPDGLRPNKNAPMLVYFYETWASTFHSYYMPAPGTSPNIARYVSNGYVMLFPDIRYHPGHPGNSALDCIMPAVDTALKLNYVDPNRVGIAGHSWAAYQINYMLTKTHRFRAAEAGAAVDDMFSAYSGIRLESGIVRESQYEHTQSRIGATPWDRPDLYLANSGLFGIKNITTPYLTIHNELDGAVPQFQGIEFITAMRRVGKEAYLFSFDGEEHNLRGREQQKYWTVHLDEWFDYWLKGAPRPTWMNGIDYLHRGERNVHPLYGEPD